MQDKRMYSRINVDIDAVLFVNNDEYPIQIVNISENGLGFRILYNDKVSQNTFSKKSNIVISFTDEDPLSSFKKKEDEAIMIFEGKIVQIRKHTSHSYIGCYVNNEEYTSYVTDKKVKNFIQKGVLS